MNSTTSRWPAMRARSMGVRFILFLTAKDPGLFLTSHLTTARVPFRHAWWSGVEPRQLATSEAVSELSNPYLVVR